MIQTRLQVAFKLRGSSSGSGYAKQIAVFIEWFFFLLYSYLFIFLNFNLPMRVMNFTTYDSKRIDKHQTPH